MSFLARIVERAAPDGAGSQLRLKDAGLTSRWGARRLPVARAAATEESFEPPPEPAAESARRAPLRRRPLRRAAESPPEPPPQEEQKEPAVTRAATPVASPDGDMNDDQPARMLRPARVMARAAAEEEKKPAEGPDRIAPLRPPEPAEELREDVPSPPEAEADAASRPRSNNLRAMRFDARPAATATMPVVTAPAEAAAINSWPHEGDEPSPADPGMPSAFAPFPAPTPVTVAPVAPPATATATSNVVIEQIDVVIQEPERRAAASPALRSRSIDARYLRRL